MKICSGQLYADLPRLLTPLVAAMDLKDELYGIHSRRVADLAALLAQRSGVIGVELEWVRLGALVHDVGKIGIPDHILRKPDRLTAAEFDIIKTHPAMGRLILSTVDGIPETILNIVHFHHERFDGRGYPVGLAGRQIPYSARLVAVADAWDAMTSRRAYRPPLPIRQAIQQMIHGIDSQFDGELVTTFLDQIVPTLQAGVV